ncbi:biotin--[acetyl-CoA-carboxylase] ligase [Microbacterium sp. NPDC090225]|uniref:biotin--[acetyl-CoA-carboxylase] ligase n=1 Tax=Microbacterium sp. NPDC090225 TaxID=3364207 RepID=UPI00381DC4F9
MDLPLARDVTPRVEYVPASASTNADLRVLAEDLVGWPHLSTLVTRNQTAGRGRLDRVWTAPDGAALAISVVVRVSVDPALRGWIPLIAGIAMADAVAAQLPAHTVGVKWPNDVLVDDHKICGILAEATVDAIIIGAGVNTAMTAEQLPVPTATSFAVQGVVADEDRLLADYLRELDALLTALVDAGDAVASGLHAAATDRITTLGRSVRVSLPGDRTLEGTARELDDEGRLVVRHGGADHPISAGDVVHVRPLQD